MTTGDHTSDTMNVEHAAKRLGIGRKLAYELARRGELPGVFRLGHRLLISRRAFERALDAPEVTGIPEASKTS